VTELARAETEDSINTLCELLEMIERYSDQDSSEPDDDCGDAAASDEVSH